MKPFLILLIAILLVATATRAQVMQDSKRIIFPETRPLFFDMLPDTALPRFTPKPDEIDSADQVLSRNSPNLKTGTYYRQYAGFISHGKQLIFINASCRKSDYFSENTFYPRGGGQCYFRALVDLAGGTV